MARTLAVFLIAGTVVLSTGALFLWKERPHTPLPPPKAFGATQLSQTPREAVRTYELALESTVSIGGDPLQDVHLAGRWVLTNLDNVNGARRIQARIEAPVLRSSTAVNEDVQRYRSELGNAIEFMLTPSGHLSETRSAPELSSFTRGVLKSIPAYAQWVRGSGSRFQTVELDTVGRYVAESICASPLRCRKTKLRYEELLGGSLASVHTDSARIVTSVNDFEFDEHGALVSLGLNETLELDPPEGLFPSGAGAKKLVSHTVVHLKRVANAVLPVLVNTQRYVAERPYENTSSGRRSDLDRARIGNRTFAEMLTELATLRGRSDDESKRQRTRLYVALSALFRLEPKEAVAALGAVRLGKQADFLIDALGDSGSPVAQQVLRTTLAESSDLERRRRVVVALGRSTPATQETVDTLASLFNDQGVAGQARLALGTAARGLAKSEPERAKVAVDTLLATLKDEQRTGYVMEGLRSLGNAGHPSTIETIKKHIASPDASIRAAAAQALRLIPDQEADLLLANLLKDDPIATVRVSSLDSLYYRDWAEPSLAAAIQASKVDVDPVVRRAAVRVLVKWKGQVEAAQAALQWVAENDEDEKIREVAREGLSREF